MLRGVAAHEFLDVYVAVLYYLLILARVACLENTVALFLYINDFRKERSNCGSTMSPFLATA